jgi:hypothetical protein
MEPAFLLERLKAAERAIRCRLQDLQYDSDQHEERQLIADAQRTYRFASLPVAGSQGEHSKFQNTRSRMPDTSTDVDNQNS